MRRRLAIGAGALAALLALVAGGGYAAYKLELFAGVDVERGETLATNEADRPAPVAQPRAHSWPLFRFDKRRTGVNPRARAHLPFRMRWKRTNFGFTEAPPVLSEGVLVSVSYEKYVGSNVIGVDARTGRLLWREETRNGVNFAGGPAVEDGIVYVPAHDTIFRAFDLHSGRLLWWFKARPNEGPPIVDDGVVYFGDGDGGEGEMYALDARTGEELWSFAAEDHISSGAALTDSTLYFASYDGSVYALDRDGGELRWRARVTSATGGSDSFYATPALARGLVIVGSLGGSVYGLDARTGEQRWRFDGTSGEVYGSVAVYGDYAWVGDFGGGFHAIDIRNGNGRWSVHPGPNLGSPTLVRDVVFISTLRPERTWGYDARSGELVWEFDDGKYSPLIADRNDVWLVGVRDLYRFTGHLPR